ncbi:MAG: hypothetical protein HY222_04310 [Thaumarchaeota archaeon]|nr:hypothetical protein [Nitrososphaerota archaeon]MBI3641598.1 hypothetical protein [Nitrososphaerota archaeon]
MSKLQTSSENTRLKKFLFYSLLATAFSLIIAGTFGKEVASQVSLSLYLIATVPFVVLPIMLSRRFGIKGNHGKAWIMFAIFASLWFIAERTIMYYDLTLHSEPFPSWADFFWILAYPFLFLFMLYYLRPVKIAISKELVIASSMIAISVLIPTTYITYYDVREASLPEIFVALSYPIGDAIVLAPAIIGLILFFRGEVNFLWSLVCIAIIFEEIADTGFLAATLINHSYYKGHPVDIPFIWAYIFFSFGVYHHIKTYRNRI